MITAIKYQPVQNNRQKKQNVNFKSEFKVITTPEAEKDLAQLRLSMNETAKDVLEQIMFLTNKASKTANEDGQKNIITMYLDRIWGIKSSGKDLNASMPYLEYQLVKANPQGKPISGEPHIINLKTMMLCE